MVGFAALIGTCDPETVFPIYMATMILTSWFGPISSELFLETTTYHKVAVGLVVGTTAAGALAI